FDSACNLGKVLRRNQPGARPGQASLAVLRKRVSQAHANQKIQDRITQEFHPFVVADAVRGFPGIRGMSKGFQEELTVTEPIREMRLKTLEGRFRHAWGPLLIPRMPGKPLTASATT